MFDIIVDKEEPYDNISDYIITDIVGYSLVFSMRKLICRNNIYKRII